MILGIISITVLVSCSLFIGLLSLTSYLTSNSSLAIDQNSTETGTTTVEKGTKNSLADNQNEPPPFQEDQNKTSIAKNDKPPFKSQPDPSKLSALLVGDRGDKHKLILYQYTTSDGTVSPPSTDYPKKPGFTLHDGDKVKLISGNQDFKIAVYSISLLDYKNDKKQPNYMEGKENEFVVSNISPGTYHLYLKTEYTPSDDDVAYFVSTVKVQNKVSNSGEETGYTGSGGEKTNTVKASGQFKKEQIQKYRTEINATIQITTFNETKPSDVIFKLTPNNHSKFGNTRANPKEIFLLSESTEQEFNSTLAGVPINQTHPQMQIIKTLHPLNQTIELNENTTLQTLPLNETVPDDIILQLAVSNITRTDNPMILRFIPTDTIAYNMELLSSNGTKIG